MTPLEFRRQLTDFLAKRGLAPADAKKLQLELCPRTEAAKRFSIDADGFVIPYFDLAGRKNGARRFRSLKLHGFAAVAFERKNRYRSEKGGKLGIYFPPLGLKWKEYVKDPSKPLVITEGELKAAAATKADIPTLGLSGVWCFKQDGQLLPAFSDIEWQDRKVYIAYDSDAATNANVASAENALARELLAMGAKPHIARLPALRSGEKTAIDDFLLAKDADALMKVLKGSEEWETSKELFALNEEVLYVEDPGLILRLENTQLMMCRAFTEHAYATRIYHERVTNAKGETKIVEKSAAKEWLKWPYRATVSRVTYAPGEPRITNRGEFNCWPGWGCHPKGGDVTPWNQLLDHLFGVEKEPRKWFEQWLAYPLQHAGRKLYSAAIVWGFIQGTGKSLVGYSMQRIYGENWGEIGERELHGNHNEWAKNKQFIMADEIEPAGETKRRSADRMKSMITQRELRLNPKYIPSYTVPDCINYYLTSNHPDSLHLENRDRRFMVHEVEADVKDAAFYRDYVDWLDKREGAQALFHRLLHLDCDGFNPAGHAPQTRAKRDMTELSRSDIATWVANLREAPDSVLRVGNQVLSWKLWTVEELLDHYPNRDKITTKRMVAELKTACFKQVNRGDQVEGSYKGKRFQKRLWAIRDAEAWLGKTPTQLIVQYAEERGDKLRDAIAAKYTLP